jgi:hypothetical protein
MITNGRADLARPGGLDQPGQTPEDRPYGVEAVMRDNSGNWMVLVETKEFSSADFA